ncbi:MAG: acyltransferase family protein [Clostridia bacterium]|nr:acyltransferase family protein [Clostridia bacterium]
MLFFLLAFIGLCLYGVKFNLKNNSRFEDYLSLEKTTSIKGIFIIIVFFSHFNKYFTPINMMDSLYFKLISEIGQNMVVAFLFYSGFGVMESIQKKGTPYLQQMPKNRMLRVLFEFQIATIFSLVYNFLANEQLNFEKILLYFISWENWYIFAILCLYTFTFLGFRWLKKNQYHKGIFLVALLTVGYILVMRQLKSRFWYDTVLCYPLGMLWSLYKDKIKLRNIYQWGAAVLSVLVAAVLLKVFAKESLIAVLIGFLLSCIFIVLCTMRISFHNKVLYWSGKYLFEIYILHRIFQSFVKETGIITFNLYLAFVICAVLTAVSAFYFEKGFKKLWGRIST